MTQGIIQDIIIDCDPGQDDAINLFMALAPNTPLNILGITTVAGNVGLDKTTRNARLICAMTGRRDVKVYAGYAAPLQYPLATAEEVHGQEGLEGIDIYDPDLPVQTLHAVDYLVQTLLAAEPASIRIIVTGPMTNIAVALTREPAIKAAIKDIVIMGGARSEGGNITPSAEFNIYVDPHAAQTVLQSGCEIVLIGLDTTHTVLSSPDVLADMVALGNPVATACQSLLTHYGHFEAQKFGENCAPMHDPSTIAYVLRPDLFTSKLCNVRVETESSLTRGHTAVDFWNDTDLPRNCRWVYAADRKGFFKLLLVQLAKYPA